MVRFLFFTLLSVALVLSSIFESNYIENVFSSLEKDLAQIETLLESSGEQVDNEKNTQAIKTLTKKWHKQVKKLKFFVWHTGIKEVEVGLSRIGTYIKENDSTEAKVELNNLLDFSKHYSQDFIVLWENIF